MTAAPYLIAGLLDGPWVFITVVIVSALANWLSKRRQEQAGGEEAPPPQGQPPAPAPADWEERLRRLLGEEMPPAPARPVQPPAPAPPVLRPSAPASAPRPPIIRPADRRPAPLLRPLPVEVVPVIMSVPAEQVAGGGVEETVRRFEQMDAAVMTPVRPISALGRRPSSVLGDLLRRPGAARQAFVASLVFGPPKALED